MRHSTVIVVSYVRRGAKDAKPRGKQVFRSREAYVERNQPLHLMPDDTDLSRSR